LRSCYRNAAQLSDREFVMLSANLDWMSPLLAWQGGGGGPDDAAAAAAGAGMMIVVLIFYALLFAVTIALLVLVYYVLYTSLARIPPQFRQMEPGQVFLLLIPFFNLYWLFVVYQKIPQSFRGYFNAIGRYDVGDCGEQMGLWFAILAVCSAIPCVNCITGPIAGVMNIMLLAKFWTLRNQIPESKLA
jgi:hypothetical protein